MPTGGSGAKGTKRLASQSCSSDLFLVLISAVAIAYVSLYPFRFRSGPSVDSIVLVLLAAWRDRLSLGDLAANVLLYFPLGFFLVRWLCSLVVPGAFCLAVLCGATLAAVLEIAQTYLPGRFCSAADVVANTFGLVAGAIAGAALSRTRFLPFNIAAQRPVPIIVVACWVGSRLYPFVPTSDLHKYWRAISPIMEQSQISWPLTFWYCAAWIGLCAIIESQMDRARALAVYTSLGIGVVAGRVVVVQGVLSWEEVAGTALGILLWSAILRRLDAARGGVAVTIFVAGYAVEGLLQTSIHQSAQSVSWLPFQPLIDQPPAIGIRGFLRTGFVAGTLVFLLRAGGLRLYTATVVGCLALLAVPFAQAHFRSVPIDIAPAVLTLVIALLMRLHHQ